MSNRLDVSGQLRPQYRGRRPGCKTAFGVRETDTAHRPTDFADACLVYMSEQTRDCRIVTIDRADFAACRRHGREPIPLLLPD